MTVPDGDELGDAVARYAASARQVEWRPPSELRQRAESRRRKRRLTLASSGSLFVALLVALSLTLPSSAPTQHTSAGGKQLTAEVKRATVAFGSTDEVKVEAAEQQFALRLTQSLLAGGQRGNVVVSPESVETVLTMLELGARGRTQQEITAALDSSALNPTAQAAGWNALTRELASDATAGGGGLTDANAVFVQSGLAVRPSYLRALGHNFGAGVEQVNFAAGPAAAAQAINSWVAKATGGAIPRLFAAKSLPRLTDLVLADAVHFSAKWEWPFLTATTMGPFVAAGGNRVTVPIMRLSAKLRYFSTDRLEGVVLPYVGGTYDAVVVEPRGASLAAIVGRLTPASLAALDASTAVVPVALSLPSFSISSEASLNDSLQRLGLGRAFMAGADFAGVTTSQIELGTVAQRDVLSVGTIGTDFRAASAASTSRYAVHGSLHTISFDHPFLFVVRDVATGAIVTEAIVNDPSGSP